MIEDMKSMVVLASWKAASRHKTYKTILQNIEKPSIDDNKYD